MKVASFHPLHQLFQVDAGSVRRHIPPVQKGVDIDLLKPLPLGQLDEAQQVGKVAVNPAVREEAQQMEGFIPLLTGPDSREEDGILVKIPVLYGFCDTGQLLVDDPPRAHVGVPHLGVAHLPLRQAHSQAGSLQLGVGVFSKNAVQIGGLCRPDRISFGLIGQAIPIQYDKGQWFFH